jgi:hypothetical protein
MPLAIANANDIDALHVDYLYLVTAISHGKTTSFDIT